MLESKSRHLTWVGPKGFFFIKSNRQMAYKVELPFNVVVVILHLDETNERTMVPTSKVWRQPIIRTFSLCHFERKQKSISRQLFSARALWDPQYSHWLLLY